MVPREKLLSRLSAGYCFRKAIANLGVIRMSDFYYGCAGCCCTKYQLLLDENLSCKSKMSASGPSDGDYRRSNLLATRDLGDHQDVVLNKIDTLGELCVDVCLEAKNSVQLQLSIN